ncbi:MAG: PAS domain S-box protein [Armatimonadetes bacterium]|nr:PAS domain S-box protein [Armatimonadota bacterium]
MALAAYQWREQRERRLPYFVAARLLQGAGIILICLRDVLPTLIGVSGGNLLLYLGAAYECATMLTLVGRPPTARWRAASALLILGASLLLALLTPAHRVLLASLMLALFPAQGGWAMVRARREPRVLRLLLGVSQLVVVGVLLARAGWALTAPPETNLFADHPIHLLLYGSLYLLMLTNGFGVLLLAQGATEQQLQEVLGEETAVLETLPSGLCILRDRVIVRCNPAMEAMLGWPPGQLTNRGTRCLYATDAEFEHYGRLFYEGIRDRGVYRGEVPFTGKDGQTVMVWLQGTSIYPERAQAYAVFSLTDIGEQKRQQAALEEQKAVLQASLDRVKRLEGIVSICMYCKKIRNERESWDQLEQYISQHTDAHFSHGICPDCFERAKRESGAAI